MNLRQLSELLGLSQTTISRALNGYPEVSEETRRRVRLAADQNGYRPNRAARRLATGKSGSIGLVIPTRHGQSSDVHFGEFQLGLAQEALRHDFHFVIMPAHSDDEEQVMRWMAASGQVDGYYLAYMRRADPRIPLAASLKMPFIVHGRAEGIDIDYPYLDVDNHNAFYRATRLLLDLGHRRFALLNGPHDYDFAIRRRQGMIDALAEQGLQLDPDCDLHGAMTDETGARAMAALLSREARPTAIVCASTVIALGAVRAINRAGLALGRDVSLIAHDDVLPLLKPEHFTVPLTTTRSSLREAGRRIAERLIADINGTFPTPPLKELWEAELVVRASTGPAPRD